MTGRCRSYSRHLEVNNLASKVFSKVGCFLGGALHMVVISVGTFTSLNYLNEKFPRGYGIGFSIFLIGFLCWYLGKFLIVPFLAAVQEEG